MKQVKATLSASLDIKCPKCKYEFDLFNDDPDSTYIVPVFNNDWGLLKGEKVYCINCDNIFQISEVEW